ncbi:hypothetical protein ACIBAG_27355 [Streptomyces sp. NPDC051243]|uniref:hypothetical protein n=1 Tax=unclassified Streptomyces TaxID=2593676 RepID=UPI0037A61F2D
MTRRATDNLDWRRTIRALSLPALIRLVSELADNGPISRRRGSLQAVFSDLTINQLSHAIDRARDFGLVYGDDHERIRYRLTPRGEDLANVYDTAACWARTHQYPHTSSDFVTRVEHILLQLGQAPDLACDAARNGSPGGQPVPDGAVLNAQAATLEAPHTALAEWLEANTYALHPTAPRSSHAVDDMERAA